MSTTVTIAAATIAWAVTAATLFTLTLRRRQTVGLVGVFLLAMATDHWIASALYILPWSMLYPPTLVNAGLQQSFVAIVAFSTGSLLFAPIQKRVHQYQAARAFSGEGQSASGFVLIPPRAPVPARLMISLVILAGLALSFSVVATPLRGIGTVATAVGVLSKFIPISYCMHIWNRYVAGKPISLLAVLLFCSALSAFGLLTTGFLSNGAFISIVVLMFYLALQPTSKKQIALMLVIAYLGLSIFTTYLLGRDALRTQVWGGSDLTSRLEASGDIISDFELFNIGSAAQLATIDERLNRNFFLGLIVYNMRFGVVHPAMGSTLINGLISPIPRVLWPNKPAISGGSSLISQYTGREFGEGTSIGSGPLIEAYINFGTPGVVMAFILLGLCITAVDCHCKIFLVAGDYTRFCSWLLVGLALAATADTFAQIVAAALSGYIVARLVLTVLSSYFLGLQQVHLRQSRS